jgi:hypothetical protein
VDAYSFKSPEAFAGGTSGEGFDFIVFLMVDGLFFELSSLVQGDADDIKDII